jgi:hypothetical protein
MQLPIQSYGSLIKRFNEEVERIMNPAPEQSVGVLPLQSIPALIWQSGC